MSIPKRISVAFEQGLSKLLTINNTASKYPLGTCRTCFHKHNSLLHIPTLPSINLRLAEQQEIPTRESAITNASDTVVAHASNITSKVTYFSPLPSS